MGTALAFCMSTVAASLRESLMLGRSCSGGLLALLSGLLLVDPVLVGWIFNALACWLGLGTAWLGERVLSHPSP